MDRICSMVVIRVVVAYFLFVSMGQNILCQENISLPKGYFASPVGRTFYLSGNFGELRETHFHTGLDIKPANDGSSDNILAAAAGFISRIYVGPSGYGRAVYIDHPDVGYTSVYAHLDNFTPEIDAIVRQHQMAKESFSIDFQLNPEVLPVQKGQQLGVMGNAGHSYGKHLHFEIRDTKTEEPINPNLFGLVAADHISPTIVSIAIHGLNPEYHKLTETIIPILPTVGSDINISNPIEIGAWRVGIAVQTIDKMDGVNNKNGIYKLHMFVDDSLAYQFQMDRLSFNQTKNIIGFYDYKKRLEAKSTYTLCYKFPNNDLSFLSENGNGLISVYATKDRMVRIELEDFEGNKSTCHFLIRRAQNMASPIVSPPFSNKILVGQPMTIIEDNCTIQFGENSLFRNIDCQVISSNRLNAESKYIIHDVAEPIKTPIKIGILPKTIGMDMSKAVILHTTTKGGKINYGGFWEDGKLSTYIKEFGSFEIAYDTIKPTIKAVFFSTKPTKRSAFTFKISDNMSSRGQYAEDISYRVWIDGVFTICPLRALNNTLEVPLAGISGGKHELKIEVVDHSKNTAVYSSTFIKA